MKIVANAESLKSDLSVVARAVSPRSTLPVLANVLFDCENGNPYLAATDLEIAITKAAKVETKEPGKITLPYDPLDKLLSKLTGEITITVNPKTQKATLKSKSGTYTLPGIDAEEFPPIPVDGKGATCTIDVDSKTFVDTLRTVVFCASTDQARPILMGVHFEIVGNSLKLQAADGFRLAKNCYTLEAPVEKKTQTVVPANALSEVMRIARSGNITIHFDPNKTLFVGSDWSLTAQRIEGSYPDLEQVIPVKHKSRALVDPVAFKTELEKCAIFNSLVKLEFGTNKNDEYALVVKAQSEEVGNGEGELAISYDGEPIVIGFNVKFLIDMLSVIKGELVIDLTVDTSPGKFSQASDPNGVFVVMPMHIG